MEIKFAPSFFKSLERMAVRERWYWKTWDFIRYDVPKGIKNIIFFWRVIWSFRSWDSTFQLRILKRSLEPLRDRMQNGNEVDETRLKKVAAITRLIYLLEYCSEDKYIDLAEEELGYEVDTTYLFNEEPDEVKEANRKIFELSRKLEEEHWKEIFKIMEGQDVEEFRKIYDALDDETKKRHDVWTEWFDGTGMKGWWD
jgi:hypothetical protein